MLYENALTVYRDVLPHAYGLLPSHMRSAAADVMLLAIGLQESGFAERVQRGGGPAHGYWQFEQGGAIPGLLKLSSTRRHARGVCAACGVSADPGSIWSAMAKDDVLAAAFARLLLWSDPFPIPAATDQDGGWAYYLKLWRPGKPHPVRWTGNHEIARRIVGV